MAEFEAITTQEEFDARIKARLAREREKWEKEGGAEDLKAQLEAREKDLARAKAEHSLEMSLRERGLVGHVGGAKVERIKRLLDFEGETPIPEQLERLAKDVPELFRMPVGAGSGGGTQMPILGKDEQPLTREEVENMDADEINRNWEGRIKAFMKGER